MGDRRESIYHFKYHWKIVTPIVLFAFLYAIYKEEIVNLLGIPSYQAELIFFFVTISIALILTKIFGRKYIGSIAKPNRIQKVTVLFYLTVVLGLFLLGDLLADVTGIESRFIRGVAILLVLPLVIWLSNPTRSPSDDPDDWE